MTFAPTRKIPTPGRLAIALTTLALSVAFIIACGSDDGTAAPEPAATAVQAQPAQPTQAAAVAPAPTTAPAAPTIVPTTAAPPTPRDLAASMGAQPTATSEPAAPAVAPTTTAAQAVPIGSEVGERAPDFEMILADGSVVSLASLMAAERPTFLYFFASF